MINSSFKEKQTRTPLKQIITSKTLKKALIRDENDEIFETALISDITHEISKCYAGME